MNKTGFLCVSLLALICASPVVAQGLDALSVNPNGSDIAASGTNRVLYRIDPATLAVIERIWVPEEIDWMDHTADGAILLTIDADSNISGRDPATLKVLWTVEDASRWSHAANAGRIAFTTTRSDVTSVTMIDTGTGTVINTFDIPDRKIDALAISEDGATAVMLTQSFDVEDEPKEDMPADLEGAAKEEFKQRHDGKGTFIIRANLDTGAVEESPSWYRVSSPLDLRMVGDRTFIIDDGAETGVIGPDLQMSLIEIGTYSGGYSNLADDGETMIRTSRTRIVLRKVTATDAEDETRLEAEGIDGESEKADAIDQGPDGTIYFTTDAWRIWSLPAGSDQIATAPVF